MTETEAKPRSRRPLIIILVVSILPIALAYFVYFTGIGLPSRTVNAGHFIEPAKSVEALVGASTWSEFQADKKWRLIVPIGAPCDASCEKNLYTSRQVHIRLAQNSERVERYAAMTGQLQETALAEIKKEHPRLTFLTTPVDDVNAWIDTLPDAISDDFYLLIDQEGRAMMSYDSSLHGNLVLKDIKRALKYSIDYQ